VSGPRFRFLGADLVLHQADLLAMAISLSAGSDVKSRKDLPAKGHGRAEPGRPGVAAMSCWR
jgi:hypothetical protein